MFVAARPIGEVKVFLQRDQIVFLESRKVYLRRFGAAKFDGQDGYLRLQTLLPLGSGHPETETKVLPRRGSARRRSGRRRLLSFGPPGLFRSILRLLRLLRTLGPRLKRQRAQNAGLHFGF